MEITVLRLPRDVARWNLVASFLRLRKEVFIDAMRWSLFESEAMEFEQYDALGTAYVIAHEGEEVRGGARLLRSDNRHGNGRYVYSYMIRDAWRGMLPGLPEALCEKEPPVAADVWELTRLATGRDPGLARDILDAANDWLRTQGARKCLFLGPPAFMRMAKSMGYDPRPMGRVAGNSDGRFLAFSCDVVDRAASFQKESRRVRHDESVGVERARPHGLRLGDPRPRSRVVIEVD